MKKKQSVDDWLNEVDYKMMEKEYVPTPFSLTFMNFIKLVNGVEGEANKTPVFHLKMLDKLAGKEQYIVNLCFRGASKTTVFMEYLSLYLGVFHHIPNFGSVDGMIYISDSMENGVKSARKNIEFRYNNSDFLQEWIPEATFTDAYIEFTNKKHEKLGIKLFGAQTGLRGTKIFGKRPVLAVLDDLVSDDAANSKVQMQTIKDTVYKGVNYALDPNKRKVILNGTPFNKNDIIIEAVESGGWDVNVWPVCERFPCSKEDFSGAWPDRFSYDVIKSQYDMAVATGKTAAFQQELMLRISSEDERLVQDSDLRWYSRKQLLNHKGNFNFYITTDFAVSSKRTADFSAIGVWAYNANGDWFWVDGIAERQTINKTFDQLFRFVSQYNPQSVGIEVTGQQLAFITMLQEQMMAKNIWFNFASSGSTNQPGIRPTTDKFTRFSLVVPWFKAGKIFFPEEMKGSVALGRMLEQISLATINGLKGHDDCIDVISMLGYLKPWKPTPSSYVNDDDELWQDEPEEKENALDSYIV